MSPVRSSSCSSSRHECRRSRQHSTCHTSRCPDEPIPLAHWLTTSSPSPSPSPAVVSAQARFLITRTVVVGFLVFVHEPVAASLSPPSPYSPPLQSRPPTPSPPTTSARPTTQVIAAEAGPGNDRQLTEAADVLYSASQPTQCGDLTGVCPLYDRSVDIYGTLCTHSIVTVAQIRSPPLRSSNATPIPSSSSLLHCTGRMKVPTAKMVPNAAPVPDALLSACCRGMRFISE